MKRSLLYFILLLLLAVFVGVGAGITVALRSASPAYHSFLPGYWHTSGTQIVDANGDPVRIAGVTWYGSESAYWVPAGLDYQPYTHVLDMVKQLGYNTIRLPFSNELVETNPIVTTGVAANPQFRGVHALDVMDAIVRYCQRIGLKVILDDHRSVASRRHNVNWLLEPLWYVPGYPESSWVQDWVTLARRY
ncbi:MAG TPA: cellulase family glycosylhydrolase, partial [Chloroflexota bacterium]